MAQCLSCNSLGTCHPTKLHRERSHNLPREGKTRVTCKRPTAVYSDCGARRRGKQFGRRAKWEVSSRKMKICSQPNGVSHSAPATGIDEAHSECSNVSVSSIHKAIAEWELKPTLNTETKRREDMLVQLESLKAELLQCREAVTYSDTRITQLNEELKTKRLSMANEKEKMAKQIQTLTRALNDHKLTVKTLTEDRCSKDVAIANLKTTLAKTEASNTCRGVTLKILQKEIQSLRKDLAEALFSENLQQKCNKELLVENSKLRNTLDVLKNKLSLLQDSNAEWQTTMDQHIEVLRKESEDNHFHCSVQTHQKLGSLKATYDHRLQLLLKKLFRADRTTKQLYRTIEKVVKGVHLHLYASELSSSNLIGQDGDNAFKSVILQLGDWLDTCHNMAYSANFSSDLSTFILTILDSENKVDNDDTDHDNIAPMTADQ